MATLRFPKLVQRIREEFEDHPNLRVNATEAARFWGLDLTESQLVLAELQLTGFLAEGPDHRYRHVA
ncbi:MAG TPA: hypothetical protein VKB50_07615 [Vicinamibacterales bacterium]|nr:hypothetical protein [Vicinamibacterales bacterium]